MNLIKRLRVLLVLCSVAAVLIPIGIVGITGQGFGATISHLLVSVSIVSLIAATLLGLDRGNKNRFFVKIGVSIGLLIVLVSVWL